MTKRSYHNASYGGVPQGAPPDVVKAEFARRLQRAMVSRGWNQSELARRAKGFTDQRIERDTISGYVRGIALPGPAKLDAICQALKVEPADLLPAKGIPGAQDRAPPFDIREVEDGMIWLRVNQAVTWQQALEIMIVLKKMEEDTDKP